jgi:hypothetical protein
MPVCNDDILKEGFTEQQPAEQEANHSLLLKPLCPSPFDASTDCDPVTITEIDGSTSTAPSGSEFTCSFSPITLETSRGNEIADILSYPEDGVFVVPNINLSDADGVVGPVAAPLGIEISNTTVASYTTNLATGDLSITVDPFGSATVTNLDGTEATVNVGESYSCTFPEIQLVTQLGVVVDTISSMPAGGEHTLPLVNINDQSILVGIFPTPTGVNITNADVAGASVDLVTGEFNIEIDLPPTITPSGTLYQGVAFNQFVSHETGDQGWLLQNNMIQNVVPANPDKIMRLDYSSPSPFWTLTELNGHGTYDRFTDTSGNPVNQGSAGVQVFQDWLTGYEFLSERQFLGQTFTQQIASASALTTNGHSDWFVVPRELWLTIVYFDSTPGNIGRTPGGGIMTGIRFNTVNPLNTGQTYVTWTNGEPNISRVDKSNTTYYCLVARKMT